MRDKLSTLLWLVVFVFVILLASILAAGGIWRLMVVAGVLSPSFEEWALHALGFILLVSLFIGSALAAVAGDFVLRPLHRLTEGTKQIASGNFDVHLDLKGSTEMEKLAESFNHMAKELSSIETLRSDFVNTISHEYKTPVASILGFAKRLRKTSLTEEQRKEYVEIIIAESERLAQLSSNVLLLSKLESSERNTDREEFLLDEQLRKVILMLEPQLQRKQLKMNINLSEVKITANEEIVRRAWINLLGNAIKFSHFGGEINIDLKIENNKAVVSIADTGIGMDKDIIARIFEKFYQGDSSRATEGNGLGLALVKKIVELEGGEIDIFSELGKGTCFTVRLWEG